MTRGIEMRRFLFILAKQSVFININLTSRYIKVFYFGLALKTKTSRYAVTKLHNFLLGISTMIDVNV